MLNSNHCICTWQRLHCAQYVLEHSSHHYLHTAKTALRPAGLGQKITDNFGEAKLLDDIIDHWDAGVYTLSMHVFHKECNAKSAWL